MTEEEFAALEDGNNEIFEPLERVAIVRRKDDGAVAIAIVRKMPPGAVGPDGQPLSWRSVTYRLEPGCWETMQQAVEDPALLQRRIDETRAQLVALNAMPPAGRA